MQIQKGRASLHQRLSAISSVLCHRGTTRFDTLLPRVCASILVAIANLSPEEPGSIGYCMAHEIAWFHCLNSCGSCFNFYNLCTSMHVLSQQLPDLLGRCSHTVNRCSRTTALCASFMARVIHLALGKCLLPSQVHQYESPCAAACCLISMLGFFRRKEVCQERLEDLATLAAEWCMHPSTALISCCNQHASARKA